MEEYTGYTKQGHWTFFAEDDISAMRLALYYAWRDGEDIIKVEGREYGQTYTLRLCKIDKVNNIQTI